MNNISLKDVQEVIEKDILKTIIVNPVSTVPSYNELFKNKITNDIVTRLIEEHKEYIYNFIENYNKNIAYYQRSLSLLGKIEESTIKRLYLQGNSIKIEVGDKIKFSFRGNSETNEPEMVKVSFLYEEKKLFDLVSFNLGETRFHKLKNINLINNNEVEKFLEDNDYIFKENTEERLQEIMNDNFIEPLKNKMELEILSVPLLNSKNTKIMMRTFNEYKEEIRNSKLPLTRFINKKDLSDAFLEKIKTRIEAMSQDDDLIVEEKEQKKEKFINISRFLKRK